MYSNFMNQICIDSSLSLEDVEAALSGKDCVISVSSECRRRITECYEFLESFSKDKVIYGINTGFGPMAQWRIDDNHLKELQYNIIRSHSTGAGKPLSDEYVRAAMLARLMTFVQAHSGVNIQVIDLLLEFLNRGIWKCRCKRRPCPAGAYCFGFDRRG